MVLHNVVDQPSEPAVVNSNIPRVFDLQAINETLHDFQCNSEEVNTQLGSAHAIPSNQIRANLLAGYQLAAEWVENNVDVFARGNAEYLLRLNHTVLFGNLQNRKSQYRRRLKANEDYFYNNGGSHVGELIDWYERHSKQEVWRLAAGLHVRMISTPELFIEGNHRTSIVLISYLLVKAGHAPLALNATLAPIYFSLTPGIQALDKRRPLSWFKMRGNVRKTRRGLLRMAELSPLRPVQMP